MPIAIAEQLQRRGIDVITVRDLETFGKGDLRQLNHATDMNRVLCTFDSDYVALAGEGIPHCGIVFGQQDEHHVGAWVEYLELMHGVLEPKEMINRLEFLP